MTHLRGTIHIFYTQALLLAEHIEPKSFSVVYFRGVGLTEERVETILHQIDLSLRTPNKHFGLNLAEVRYNMYSFLAQLSRCAYTIGTW